MTEFVYTDEFKKNLKPLAKKYRSIFNDLARLETELTENPYQGVKIGEDVYKIRMAIKSKGKGKSGGARVITYVPSPKSLKITVYFLAIYDKSDMDSIQDVAIQYIIESIEEDEADTSGEEE